jgi:RNA polymerase sigma factor (TIGR02999 family)
MSDVTRLLEAARSGDSGAAVELLPLLYDELRRLAVQRLAHEPAGQTLQATALVHEAYLRLVDVEQQQRFDSRGHFFAVAAEAMRRILVENARRKRRLKHGGQLHRVSLEEADVAIEPPEEGLDLIELDAALESFAVEEPRKAELVKLRYFAGLSEEDAADVLGVSRPTAARWWAFARAWLYERMQGKEAAWQQQQQSQQ